MAARWTSVVTGLEALFNTDPEGVTRQFKRRCAAVASELNISLTAKRADEAYRLRSRLAHGAITHVADHTLELYIEIERLLRERYRFDVWTTDNGLPENGVRAIAQTPDDYLWFTTFDGLVRFDGVHFTTFSTVNTRGIINDGFCGLYGAKDGTLYATTTENGVLTVYRQGVFTSYTAAQVPGRSIQRMEPDPAGEVRFLVEDDNRVTKTWYYLRDGAFVLPRRSTRMPRSSLSPGPMARRGR
jgi:Two component regulator propeller